MKTRNYKLLIKKAKAGNPHSILELAKLYKSGAFGESNSDKYIFWMKKFFKSKRIKRIVSETEHYPIDAITRMLYRSDVIEAGLSLGIYYSRSSKKNELWVSIISFKTALEAISWKHLKGSDYDDVKKEIIVMLLKVLQRYSVT